jgi:hypothetical protein
MALVLLFVRLQEARNTRGKRRDVIKQTQLKAASMSRYLFQHRQAAIVGTEKGIGRSGALAS